ncbi:hypothetical protein KA078_00780 [Candidatus Woesebacteria bacterium]|nr:hypothetical protein [Candidatus Woesebacteria bacterium]
MNEILMQYYWWFLGASIASGILSIHFWTMAFLNQPYHLTLDEMSGEGQSPEDTSDSEDRSKFTKSLILPVWLSFASLVSFFFFAVGLLLSLVG